MGEVDREGIEGREKHDAMIDCLLLAKVYIELIGGSQHVFSFDGLNKEPKDIKSPL